MGKVIILWVMWRIKSYKAPKEGLAHAKYTTNPAFYSFLPTEQTGIGKLRDAKRLDQGCTAGEQKVCAYCLHLEFLSPVMCGRA